MKRKVTFDMSPFSISTEDNKWIVAFSLYGVEFATQPIDTIEEARDIAKKVYDRIPDWTGPFYAWVEEED